MTLQVAGYWHAAGFACREGQPGWLVVAEQECRDLWTSGRGLILLFLFSVLLSAVAYLTSTNLALNFLEQRESVNLVLQFAVAVGVLATLVVSADGISGERERGTLETLLVTPVSRRSIIIGKLIAALTLWFATFSSASRTLWVLGRDVGILGPALALGFGVGTLLAVGLGSIGLLISAACNSNKTSVAASIFLLLILFAPTQLPSGLPQGWFFEVLLRANPVASGLTYISSLLVEGHSWTQDLSYLITPLLTAIIAGGALMMVARPGTADARGDCGMRKLFLIGVLVGLLTWLTAPAGAAAPLSVQVVAEPAQRRDGAWRPLHDHDRGHHRCCTHRRNPGASERREHRGHRLRRSGGLVAEPQPATVPGTGRKPETLMGVAGSQCGPLCGVRCRRAVRSEVAGHEELLISPLVNLTVANRSTLTAQGALPIVISIPLLLGLAAAGFYFGARRRAQIDEAELRLSRPCQRTTPKPPVQSTSSPTASLIWRKPIASSSRARLSPPASMASRPRPLRPK